MRRFVIKDCATTSSVGSVLPRSPTMFRNRRPVPLDFRQKESKPVQMSLLHCTRTEILDAPRKTPIKRPRGIGFESRVQVIRTGTEPFGFPRSWFKRDCLECLPLFLSHTNHTIADRQYRVNVDIRKRQMSALLLNPFGSFGDSKLCCFSPVVASVFEVA